MDLFKKKVFSFSTREGLFRHFQFPTAAPQMVKLLSICVAALAAVAGAIDSLRGASGGQIAEATPAPGGGMVATTGGPTGMVATTGGSTGMVATTGWTKTTGATLPPL